MRQSDIDRIRAAALEILALTERAEPQIPVPPRAGRKPSLDEAGIAKALALLNDGHSRAAVAEACGVSPTTIHNYFKWSPRKKIWSERQK